MKFVNSLAIVAALVSSVYVQGQTPAPSPGPTPCGKMYGGKMDCGGGCGAGKMYGGKMSGNGDCTVYPTCTAPSGQGKMYGGKMDGGKMDSEARFLRQLERHLQNDGGSQRRLEDAGKMYGGKMGGGKMSSSGGGGCCEPAYTCEVPDEQLNCGDVILNEYVTMKTAIQCQTGTQGASDIAITLIGEDAVLDCKGWGRETIIMGQPDTSSVTIGLLLLDGASAKNCHVYGFNRNIQMGLDCSECSASQFASFEVGGETILCEDVCESESTMSLTNIVSYGSRNGVTTRGAGCFSVDCSKIVDNDTGLDVQHDGTLIMTDSDVFANNNRGLWVRGPIDIDATPPVEGELYVALINSNFYANARPSDTTNTQPGNRNAPGIQVGNPVDPWGRTIVEIFGVTKSIGNEGQGLIVVGQGSFNGVAYPTVDPQVDIIETLELEYAGQSGAFTFPNDITYAEPQGFLIEYGEAAIEEEGLLYSCNYWPVGLDVEEISPAGDLEDVNMRTFNICDDDTNTDIECRNMCAGLRTADVCTGCPSGQYGKMYGGKMNGGKMSGGLSCGTSGKMATGKMDGGKMDRR